MVADSGEDPTNGICFFDPEPIFVFAGTQRVPDLDHKLFDTWCCGGSRGSRGRGVRQGLSSGLRHVIHVLSRIQRGTSSVGQYFCRYNGISMGLCNQQNGRRKTDSRGRVAHLGRCAPTGKQVVASCPPEMSRHQKA